MSVIIEFVGGELKINQSGNAIRIEIANTSSVSIEVKDISNVELRLNIGGQPGAETGAGHFEPPWNVQRVKALQRARDEGRKIELSSVTVIVYNNKVYLDRCWPSDITVFSNALPLEYVKNLVSAVEAADLEQAKMAVRSMLQSSDRVTIRRLARSPCAVDALAELAVKVRKGEVQL